MHTHQRSAYSFAFFSWLDCFVSPQVVSSLSLYTYTSIYRYNILVQCIYNIYEYMVRVRGWKAPLPTTTRRRRRHGHAYTQSDKTLLDILNFIWAKMFPSLFRFFFFRFNICVHAFTLIREGTRYMRQYSYTKYVCPSFLWIFYANALNRGWYETKIMPQRRYYFLNSI